MTTINLFIPIILYIDTIRRIVAARRMEVGRIRDYYNSIYGAHLILYTLYYYYYIIVPLLIILLHVRRTSMHTVTVAIRVIFLGIYIYFL